MSRIRDLARPHIAELEPYPPAGARDWGLDQACV
jgi:hypothetical protein